MTANSSMSPTLNNFRASVDDVLSLASSFDAYRVFYGRPSDMKIAERFLLDQLSAKESVIFFCRQSPSGLVGGFTQLALGHGIDLHTKSESQDKVTLGYNKCDCQNPMRSNEDSSGRSILEVVFSQ